MVLILWKGQNVLTWHNGEELFISWMLKLKYGRLEVFRTEEKYTHEVELHPFSPTPILFSYCIFIALFSYCIFITL